MKYIVSAAAAADLLHIAEEGLSRFGANQARSYLDNLNRTFKLIAAFPRSHRERPELLPPQRVCGCGAHLIFYEIEGQNVRITRIRHGREDWQED